MNTGTNENVPLNELRDVITISDDELGNGVEGDLVGRYAGQLKFVDSEARL